MRARVYAECAGCGARDTAESADLTSYAARSPIGMCSICAALVNASGGVRPDATMWNAMRQVVPLTAHDARMARAEAPASHAAANSGEWRDTMEDALFSMRNTCPRAYDRMWHALGGDADASSLIDDLLFVAVFAKLLHDGGLSTGKDALLMNMAHAVHFSYTAADVHRVFVAYYEKACGGKLQEAPVASSPPF
jgi:hypothetical protein